MPPPSGTQPTLSSVIAGKLSPRVHTLRIHAVRIDVSPSVALRATSVKVRINSVTSVRIVGKMPSTMTLTQGTRNIMCVWLNQHDHILESPRMRVVPVTVACFVLHGLRISDVDDFLKIIFLFIFCWKFGGFFVYSTH